MTEALDTQSMKYYLALCRSLVTVALGGEKRSHIKNKVAGHQWLTSVILATWKAQIRRIRVQGQPRKIV
jgi:hypothetical protein